MPPAAVVCWLALRQPGHQAGLAVLLLAGLVVAGWLGLFVPSGRAAAGVLVPRKWRAAHRHWHGREHCASARHSKRLWTLAKFAGRFRCVYCGSRMGLEVDHFVPWSLGGPTALANLMVLCRLHNRVKSNYWPGHHYRSMPGADNRQLAAEIFAAEWRARRSPVWWLLVAIAALL